MRVQGPLIFTLTLGMAAAALAQDNGARVQGNYVQPASGMTFPQIVGDFRRESVRQNQPDATDISVGYQRRHPGAEIVGTVYSYPTPVPPATVAGDAPEVRNKLCGALAAQIVKAIETDYPSAHRLQTNLITLIQNGVVQNGYHARYSMTVPNFMNRPLQGVQTEAYVFCYAGGKWTVEYRFTYPESATDAANAIAQFMNNLKWTFTQSQ